MKLPNFIHHNGLNRLRHRMRAELVQWHSGTELRVLNADEMLQTTGLDISPEDLEYPEDGTLEYKGRKVVVYIRDQIARFQPYKFHVANCNKLMEMRAEKRYDRYVVATRTDGKFTVNTRYEDNRIEKGAEHSLDVCMYCLEKLNYKDYNEFRYAERREIRDSFELHEFFFEYNSQIAPNPTYDDTTAPLNDYTRDWPQISLHLRERNNWTCERCGSDYSTPDRQQLLHVHHVNGILYDNTDANLRVLCNTCHAREPQHEHMRSDLD